MWRKNGERKSQFSGKGKESHSFQSQFSGKGKESHSSSFQSQRVQLVAFRHLLNEKATDY